jgi:hypothetical protein
MKMDIQVAHDMVRIDTTVVGLEELDELIARLQRIREVLHSGRAAWRECSANAFIEECENERISYREGFDRLVALIERAWWWQWRQADWASRSRSAIRDDDPTAAREYASEAGPVAKSPKDRMKSWTDPFFRLC